MNEMIQKMNTDQRVQARRMDSARQFLQSIEQTLQQATAQAGQQPLELRSQEAVAEFCKRLNKEKRFIAKVQRMVRDQEKNSYFSKESPMDETSIKLQQRALLPTLSECWKW